MGKKVLVTGATGFVGRALVERLIKDGYRVRAAIRSANVSLPAEAERAFVGDVGSHTDWSAALDGVEAIAHLAARVHVRHEDATDPFALYRSVNAEGTARLAGAARTAGLRRLVYISTIGVHGAKSAGRSFEELTPVAPHSPYARAKLEGEIALQESLAGSTTEWTILRAPLTYGPHAPGNFARLARLVARGVPLPFGAVRNRRSLVYVGNLVDAIVQSLTHPAAAGRTFMVSDGEDVSTAELVRRIARALGRPPRLVPVPPALLRAAGALAGRREDVARLLDDLVVDSGLLRRTLGWTPPYTLDEGLTVTMAAIGTEAGTSA